MAQSYFGAGAGQSGPVQSGLGGLTGLDSGNDDNLVPEYYSKILNNRSKDYAKLFKAGDVTNAYNEYNSLYRGNDPLARENAAFYGEQAKGILGDNTRTADTYERLRSGNLSSLGDVFKSVLDYGLSTQKARLAAGGFGGSGPSAYDRILSSTMTASNLSPVLNTIYGNLGRDASSAVTGDRAWDAYRMGQFATDPLTGYTDAATAGRAINPLLTYRGLINNDIGGMSNLLNSVIKPNLMGMRLDPGLSSRLNNVAAGFMNAFNFGTSAAGSFGGMGGMGGMGGGGGGGGAPAGQTAGAYSEYMGGGPNPGGMPAQYGGYGGMFGVGAAPALAYQPANLSGVGGYGGYGVQY